MAYPAEGSQTASLVLRVPERLAVWIEGGIGVKVSHVAAARIDGAGGGVEASAVSGALTGTSRSGTFTVRDAGSVKLTLVRARATFSGVAKGLTLDLNGGECRISGSSGPIDITANNATTSIDAHDGAVRVSGQNGAITIDSPRAETTLDLRHTAVTLTLAAPVPLTLVTTDEALRLTLVGPPLITLDAIGRAGSTMHLEGFDFEPERLDSETHLLHRFGDAHAPRVSVRNTRGEIVIARRK